VKRVIYTHCPVTTELVVKILEESGRSFSLYGRGNGEYVVFDSFEQAAVSGVYDEGVEEEFAVFPVDKETVKELCVRHRVKPKDCRKLYERLRAGGGALWFASGNVTEITFEIFRTLLKMR